MDTKKLYNELYIKTKIGEASFRRAYNGAVRYILSRYGLKYTTDDRASLFIKNTGDESSLFGEYYEAVGSYIESCHSDSQDKYGNFTALSELAYRTVWKRKSRGKRIRGCYF